MVENILYSILLFIGAMSLVYVVWGVSTLVGLVIARGVPFVPLRKQQIYYLGENLKLSSSDRVVDLGCGDGRVLRFFEKKFGVTDLTGFEINYWAVLRAKIWNKYKKSSAKVNMQNFYNEDISKYNIVFCYLLEKALVRLKYKFDKELKPGTKVISYGFEIKNWRTPEIIYCNPENHQVDRIFVYTI